MDDFSYSDCKLCPGTTHDATMPGSTLSRCRRSYNTSMKSLHPLWLTVHMHATQGRWLGTFMITLTQLSHIFTNTPHNFSEPSRRATCLLNQDAWF